ncbi:hypothetical protein ScPMuIL_005756 [Solemya velum]
MPALKDKHENIMMKRDCEIKGLLGDDIAHAYELEKEGFPKSHAASFDLLMYRHLEAPGLMIGYFAKDELVGYISGTRYHGSQVTEESKKMHIPNGGSVCIHSVCVKTHRRRQGIGTKLVQEFVQQVKLHEQCVERIVLVTNSILIPLFTKCGFVLRWKSLIVNGPEALYELELQLLSQKL